MGFPNRLVREVEFLPLVFLRRLDGDVAIFSQSGGDRLSAEWKTPGKQQLPLVAQRECAMSRTDIPAA